MKRIHTYSCLRGRQGEDQFVIEIRWGAFTCSPPGDVKFLKSEPAVFDLRLAFRAFVAVLAARAASGGGLQNLRSTNSSCQYPINRTQEAT